MAPGRSRGKRTPVPKDEASRSKPTLRTQDLYNAFRRLEDQEFQTPYASPISSSTRPTADIDTDDDQPPTKKQKAQRQGPLDAEKRARAAFMRAIGACQDCKSRKVQCSHFDHTRFEQQYQAQYQTLEAAPLSGLVRRPPTPSVSIAPDQAANVFIYPGMPYHIPPSYPGTASGGPPTPSEPFPPAQTPNGLVHTGSWHDENLPRGEGWEVDIGNIEDDVHRQLPLTPTMPNFPVPLGIPDEAPPLTFEHPVSQNLDVHWTSHDDQMVHDGDMVPDGLSPRNPLVPESGQFVGIAQKQENHSAWECKHGHDSIPASGVGVEACRRVFPSLAGAVSHYSTEHAALVRNWSIWKCRDAVVRGGGIVCCDTLWRTEDGDPRARGIACVECGGYRWQLWQYGLVNKMPGSAQGASACVVSRDGAPVGGKWSSSNHLSAQAFLDPTSSNARWPGRDMGGGYCGSQRSHDPLKAVAHGVRCWAKQRRISQRWGPAASLLVIVSHFLSLDALLWQCLLWLASRLASKNVETTRNIVFWGSLSCLMAGGVLMWWLLKYVQSRPSRGRKKPVRRCLVLTFSPSSTPEQQSMAFSGGA